MKLSVMAIAFCLKNPNVTSVILGATKEQQLLENLEAMDQMHKLTDDVLAEIRTIC